MADQLIFDQGASDALDVMAAPYAVTSMAFPAPPLETSTVGNIDTEGDLIAARRHQNRTVNLTVDVTGTSQADVETQLAPLQAKFAKVAREGGTLTRVTSAGTTRTLDLLAGDQYEPTFDLTYFLGNVATVQIGLVARPYARGTEVQIATATGTGYDALVTTTSGATAGDVPGLARIVVQSADFSNRHMIFWGLQGANYDSAASAALVFEAEALHDPSSAGTTVSVSGASGGSVRRFTVPFGSNLGMLDLAPNTPTHVGDFRIIARVRTETGQTSDAHVWLEWSPRRTGPPAANATVALPQAWTQGTWRLVDLGIVRVPAQTRGGKGWSGTINATQVWSGSVTLSIDTVMLVPITEGSGVGGMYSDGMVAPVLGDYVELRTDAIESSYDLPTPTYFSTVAYEGDMPTIPIAGHVRVIARPMVSGLLTHTQGGDTSTDADDGYDATLTVFHTPRYLTVF